ncbi:MAG: NUDIX hydrolase [Hyphomicrobiaceae bacterium]
MFNGTVHVLVAGNVANRTFVGKYARTDFASYLFWRESGFSDPASCDCFATVLLLGRQGRLLAAKAAPHTLNAGLFVAPGGIIDERDVDIDQNIDLTSYAMREVFEETGLRRREIRLDDGVWIARDGALIAMALVGRVSCSDDELVERIIAHNAQADDAEFAEVCWLDCDALEPTQSTPHYLKLLMAEMGRRPRGD